MNLAARVKIFPARNRHSNTNSRAISVRITDAVSATFANGAALLYPIRAGHPATNCTVRTNTPRNFARMGRPRSLGSCANGRSGGFSF